LNSANSLSSEPVAIFVKPLFVFNSSFPFWPMGALVTTGKWIGKKGNAVDPSTERSQSLLKDPPRWPIPSWVLVWFPCFIKGYDIPRPCYNCITASDPSIGIETKLLKPIPISINSHADTFIPIQKLIAQIFV
jgi:hypothetical protein